MSMYPMDKSAISWAIRQNTRRRCFFQAAITGVTGMGVVHGISETTQNQPVSVPQVQNETNNAAASLDIQTNRPTSFWDQQYMFGDWGGTRSQLAERGVTFDLNNIGDFQADVSGSQAHHATYFGRFRVSSDVDLNKLVDFDG